MDGVGLRVAGYDLQQIIGELRRGAVWCRFGKVPPRLRLDAAEDVGRAAPLVLRIAPRNPSRPHGPQWTDIGVQDHRLLIHAYDGLTIRQRIFIQGQHIFHAGDVLLIQFGDAPAFFPATASARGSEAGWGSSLGPHAAPVFVSLLRWQSAARSTAPRPVGADHTPWR